MKRHVPPIPHESASHSRGYEHTPSMVGKEGRVSRRCVTPAPPAAATPKFEVKRPGTSGHSNDCMAVPLSGYSTSNFAGAACSLASLAAPGKFEMKSLETLDCRNRSMM